jgi:sec-independent protein translocase protein TatA
MRAMFSNIGPLEIGIVLIIALIVFGPKRLPELGSSLGRGIREFKETVTGDRHDEDEPDEEPDDEVKALSASTATAEPAEPEVAASDKRS